MIHRRDTENAENGSLGERHGRGAGYAECLGLGERR